MARKPENQFISGVHGYLPPKTNPYRAKIKNPFVAGIWDWWYSGTRADLWVEYKYLPALPKRDTTLILPDLSPLQLQWGAGRHSEGRRMMVVVGHPDGAMLFEDRSWEVPVPAADYRVLSITRAELAERIKTLTMI